MQNVTKKYVEAIQSKVKQSTIKNKWQLYKIVCEVITKESSSIDVRDRQLKAVVGKMHRTFKSVNLTSLVTPSEPEGGAIKLTDAYKSEAPQEVTPVAPSEPEQEIKFTNNVKGFIAMELVPSQTILPMTVKRKGKRKFAVMQGDTELRIFKKHKQAQKFLNRAA